MKTEKKYFDNGNIKEEYEVNEKGKCHGKTKLYHENGQLQVEVTYTNGVQDNGNVISYHSNGIKARKVTLTNHIFNGPYYEWHKNGKLKTEGFYSDRVPTILKEWDENGKLINQNCFSIGKGLFNEVPGEKEIKINWLQMLDQPIVQVLIVNMCYFTFLMII